MKRDKDWIEPVRDALREAEVPLPQGGWERLARELPGQAPKPLWVRRWPKYAAAAAVVLICVVAGDAYRRVSRHVEAEVPAVVTAWADGGNGVSDSEPFAGIEAGPELAAAIVPVRRAAPAPARNVEAYSLSAPVAATGSISEPQSEKPESDVAATSVEPQEKTHNLERRLRQASAVFDDPFAEPVSRRRGGMLFGAKAGGVLSGAGTGAGRMPLATTGYFSGDQAVGPMRIDFGECTYAHRQPLSFAVTVGKAFSHGLSLESGVVYTLLRSKVTVPYASGEVGQSLHMIGIPVRLNWFWLNRGAFSLYLSGGGIAEKCIAARFGDEKVREKSVQLSAFAAVGAQYRFGTHVGLYLEPEVSYYFTQTTLRTSRTDSPAGFSLQLGLRFTY